MDRDLSYMTADQQTAYLAALIRIKRIECGIDPDNCSRREDWNEPPEKERTEAA